MSRRFRARDDTVAMREEVQAKLASTKKDAVTRKQSKAGRRERVEPSLPESSRSWTLGVETVLRVGQFWPIIAQAQARSQL